MALLQNNFIKVVKGGTTYKLPTPKSLSVDYQDFDSDASTRSTDGTMVRDRITIKRKINMEWGPMTPEEMSLLLTAVYTSDFEYLPVKTDAVALPDPNVWITMDQADKDSLAQVIKGYTGVTIPANYDTYTEDQANELRNKIEIGLNETNADRNDNIFFRCIFLEPMKNQIEDDPNVFWYVGDRSATTLWSIYNPNTGRHETMYNGLTMNFIEK